MGIDPLKKISSLMLVGNVDADDALFRAACEVAWLTDWVEYAVVAVDTAIGALDPAEATPAERRLLEICDEARDAGALELIFTFPGEAADEGR